MQLREANLDTLLRSGVATSEIIRNISLSMLKLNTLSLEEFAIKMAWPETRPILQDEVE